MGIINTGGITGGTTPTIPSAISSGTLSQVAPLLNLDTLSPAASPLTLAPADPPGSIALAPANLTIMEFYKIVNTAIQVLNETLSAIQVGDSLLQQKYWVASFEQAAAMTAVYAAFEAESYLEGKLYSTAKTQLSTFQVQVNNIVSSYNQSLDSAQPQLKNMYQNMLIYDTVYPISSTFISGSQPAYDAAQLKYTSAIGTFTQAQQNYSAATITYNSAQQSFMVQEQAYLQANSVYNNAVATLNNYTTALNQYLPGTSQYNTVLAEMQNAQDYVAKADVAFQAAQASYAAASNAFAAVQSQFNTQQTAFNSAVAAYFKAQSQYAKAQQTYNQVFSQTSQLNGEYKQAQQTFQQATTAFSAATNTLNTARSNYSTANQTFAQDLLNYQTQIANATPGTKTYSAIVANFTQQQVNFRNTTLAYQSALFKYSIATVTFNNATTQYRQASQGFLVGQQAVDTAINIWTPTAPVYVAAVNSFKKAQSAFNSAQLIYNSAYNQWGVSQGVYNSAAGLFATAALAFNTECATFTSQQNTYNAAETQYKAAEQLFASQEAYYNYVKANYPSTSSTYINEVAAFKVQEATFNQAIQTYDAAQSTYNIEQKTYASDQATYQNAVKAYETAQQTYNSATQTYDNAVASYDSAAAIYNQAELTFASATMTFIATGPVDPQTQADYNNAVATFQAAEAAFNQQITTFQAAQSAYQAQENAFVTAQNTYATQEQAYISQQNTYTADAATFASQVAAYNGSIAGSSPGQAQYLNAINTYIPQQTTYNTEVQSVYDPAEQTYAQNTATFDGAETTYDTAAHTFDTSTVAYNNATIVMNQAQVSFDDAINILEKNNYNRITAKYDTFAQTFNVNVAQADEAKYQSAVNTYLQGIAADNAQIAQFNAQRSALPYGDELPKIGNIVSQVPLNLYFSGLPANIPSAPPNPDVVSFLDAVPVHKVKLDIPINSDINNPQAIIPLWIPSSLATDVSTLLNTAPVYTPGKTGSIFQANDTTTPPNPNQPETPAPTFLDAFTNIVAAYSFFNKLIAQADAYNQAQVANGGKPVSPIYQNAYIYPFPQAFVTTSLASGPVAGAAEPSLPLGLSTGTLDSLIGAAILQIVRNSAFVPQLVPNQLQSATLSILSQTGLFAALPTLRLFSGNPGILTGGISPALSAGLGLSYTQLLSSITSGTSIDSGVLSILKAAGLSTAQIEQITGGISSAIKIAYLEFAVFQMAAALGLPGLTAQLFGNIAGIPGFATLAAQAAGVNLNTVLGNSVLAAFMAQYLAQELAQLLGVPIMQVAESASAVLASVLSQLPFTTDTAFLNALAGGFQSAGYDAHTAALLADAAAAYLAAEQQTQNLDAAYNQDEVQQAVLTNNLFLQSDIRQAVIAAETQSVYQTNRQFRDAIVQQLKNQGETLAEATQKATEVMQAIQATELATSEINQAILTESLVSSLVQQGIDQAAAQQEALTAAAAVLSGNYASELSFRNALSAQLQTEGVSAANAAAAATAAAIAFNNVNPLESIRAAEILTQDQLAEALTVQVVKALKPQLGTAGAFDLAQQITAAIIGPPTNTQVWGDQVSNPMSVLNQLNTEIANLNRIYDNKIVQRAVAQQTAEFITPSVNLYDFTLRTMDPANTFLISMGWGLMYQGMGTQPSNYLKSVDFLV